MNYPWKQDAIKHAQQTDPDESCGIVAIKDNQEKYYLSEEIGMRKTEQNKRKCFLHTIDLFRDLVFMD